MTREDFAARLAVSRETLDRLVLYAELLCKWQAKINLVGPATIPDLWRRHMLDSGQLLPYLRPGPILDLGSGAGFPGLVLAILRGGEEPVHLVEADGRKAAFLREAVRLTGAPARIHATRIETLAPFAAANVTARALAPLNSLLDMAEPFLAEDSQALFLKGRRSEEELTEAGNNWRMRVQRIESLSDPEGLILRLNSLHRKEVHRGRD